MRWEYDKIDLNCPPRKSDDVDLLNAAGREGWELVHITSNNIAYLKRLLAPAKEPAKRGAK